MNTITRHFIAMLGMCALAMTGLSGTSHAQTAPIVMKLGTATVNDAQHEWMKRFAAQIDQDTGGRIKVEIYPSSQLGQIPRMIEQTQFGAIQGFVGPPEFLTGVDSRFQLLSAPGLFKDIAHANRTLQDPEFNKAFLQLGSDKGLKGLGLFISGPTVFVSRKPITKLEDFEGLKTRVPAGSLQIGQVRALKAAPVPMSLGEVLPALQQGALDGVMSCVPIFVALRFNDAAKHLIETNHGIISATTVISKLWFDKLPADLQEAVVNAGKKVSEDVYQFSLDDVNNGYETWVKNGGEIVRLAPEDQKRLMELVLPVGEEVTSKNPKEKALYDTLLAAAERTKN